MATKDTNEDSAVREPTENSKSGIFGTSVAVVKNSSCLSCSDPRRWPYRYTVLILVCMITVGFYYCSDSLTALQRTIIHIMQIDSSKYDLFTSVYYWPNAVIPIFCGFFIDRVSGIRIGAVIFSAIICVGQLIVAFSGMFNNFPVMFVGRIVYGLIGDSLQVVQNVFAIMWFKPTELSRVFGFVISFSRIGSTLSLNTNQGMYSSFEGTKHERLGGVFFVGFAICILSLLCAFVLGLLDRRAERILRRKRSIEKIHPTDIKEFPGMFWLLVFICVTYYVTVLPFVGVAMKFFIHKYGLSYTEANLVSSLVYLFPTVMSPIIGYIVDKSGYNLVWLNSGIIITLIGHGIFSFLPSAVFIPYVAMVLMGIAYSMIGCVLWPLVAFLISDYQLGTAYGILQAIQNLGLATAIIVAGVILERCGYFILEIIFEALLCLSLFAGICLYKLDSNSGSQLNMSRKSRTGLHSGISISINDAGKAIAPVDSELVSNAPGNDGITLT